MNSSNVAGDGGEVKEDPVKEDQKQLSAEAIAESEEKPVVMTTRYFEPPTFMSETKTYETYKEDLYMWSRITSVPKKNQAEVVVYGLEGHASRIKEKIVLNIGSKIKENDNGIQELIAFLDTIYKADEMADAWAKYKAFQKVSRKDNTNINDFIADFDKEYILAKSAGCEYSDTLLAFRLLEATRVNEMDEKFVLTGIDFPSAKTEKNLYTQMKTSLKKFHGRKVVTEHSGEGLRYDPTLVASVAEALVAQGWKRPGRRRSNTDPGEVIHKKNSGGYKGKKNPLGGDGKPLACFKCQSVYHLQDKCDKNKKNVEYGMIATCNSDDCEFVMVVDTEEQLCFMVKECGMKGVIDSACSKTVAGIHYINDYVELLPDHQRSLIDDGNPSKTIYQFGGGERRASIKTVNLPVIIGEVKITIKTEVVEADIPLLIGANSLETSNAILDFGVLKATIFSVTVPLIKVSSGHFCITLHPNNNNTDEPSEVEDEIILHTINVSDELTHDELKKLHHLCGHSKRLEKLINKAGKMTSNTRDRLTKIQDSCDSCQKNQKRKPRPKFSLPRAERFNQIVTIDLKEYDRNDPEHRYICYLIDMHTRLVAAKFITDKKPAQIVLTIMEKWIGVGYGMMEGLHTDIGGEMSNAELDEVASKLDIAKTTTSAYCPHQNGVNERNHATVDVMMKKMIDCDLNLSPDMALFWSLNAKNCLENCYGFSPYQLVFATNPQLPSVTQCGPPGLEHSTKSQEFARNMNAMHNARQAFIKAQSDDTLKKALKSRIYARGDDIVEGDTIYYKKGKDKSWQGPDKVIGINGKKIFIDKGSNIATVNRDEAVIQGEEFWSYNREDVQNEVAVPQNQEVETCDAEIVNEVNNNTPNGLDENAQRDEDHPADEHIHEGQQEEQMAAHDNIRESPIKKGDTLKFVTAESNQEIEGRVMSRAGKKGGLYGKWWNIHNNETGEEKSYDTDKFVTIEKVHDPALENTEQVFVVHIPRFLHKEQKCVDAKEKELSSWDEFEVYEEVPNTGQETLGTSWILTEKVIDGKLGVKARLCVRGDQEKCSFRTDSPTVHKTSINLFFILAAKNGWRIQTSDIKCAFLQGEKLDREVFLIPPKERRVKGILWKMLKRAYGFTDASRGFYLEVAKTAVSLGCVQSKFDPAVYLYFSKITKILSGLLLTHVDDFLHGSGDTEFHNNVMNPMKRKFKFGSEEQDEFRYIGMQIKQNHSYIEVDQDHYLETMEIPQPIMTNDEDVVMTDEDQSNFRSLMGRIGWLGNHSRPDLVYDHISLSTKLGKATYGDFAYAIKVLKKMLSGTTKMVFPKLGDVSSWVIDVFADAGFKSLPDEISSCGGQVVIVRDTKSNSACVISWRGRKLKRIVTSPSAAETLALNDGISEAIFVKALLGELFGTGVVNSIPLHLYTDSKNVQKSVNSTAMVEDPRLRTEIGALKESIEKQEVSTLKRVDSKAMIANCLTKRGASAKDLLTVLRTGKMSEVPSV